MAPRWPKMAPRWPKMAPRGTQVGPRWPKIAPRWPKIAPRWPQDSPKRAPRWLKRAPRWRQDGLRGPLGPMIFGTPKMAAGSPGFGSVLEPFLGALMPPWPHQMARCSRTLRGFPLLLMGVLPPTFWMRLPASPPLGRWPSPSLPPLGHDMQRT